MTPTQFSVELSKVFSQAHHFHSYQQKKEFEDPLIVSEFLAATKQLSEQDRYIKFLNLRLSIYKGIIDDIGYFPVPLLMDAVVASAATIRSLSLINDLNGSSDRIFHHIRELGNGLSRAPCVELEKNRVVVAAYIDHPAIKALTSEATAGDYFLFNSILYATGQAPFKGINVSPVVEHYFARFSANNSTNDLTSFLTSTQILKLALEQSAEDIFGNDNPLFTRFSIRPNSPSMGVTPLIFLIAIAAIIWFIFK